MFKKLFIGLAPLFAIAAFAVMPVAAQGLVLKHWYKNNAIAPAGEVVPVVMSGEELNVKGTYAGFGEVNCQSVGGGTIENTAPISLEPGGGRINAYTFYECKAPQCEAEIFEKLGVAGRGESHPDESAVFRQHTQSQRRVIYWLDN